MASETPSVSRLRLLGERPLEAAVLPPAPEAPAALPSRPSAGNYHAQTTAALAAIAMVLSARILLLLAVLAAFVLSLIAVLDPTTLKLYLTLTFDLCVLVPLVVLYSLKG